MSNSTPGSKRPKFLTKLSLKQEETPFTPHITDILEKNNLKLFSDAKKRNLMEAISESLFLTSSKASKLQKHCLDHVREGITADNLLFISEKKDLLEDYEKEPLSPIFEALNLELVANMFEVKIVLYSVFSKNNLLYSTIFNNSKEKKIELLAVVQSDEIFYGAVFQKDHLEKVLVGLSPAGASGLNPNKILEDAETHERNLKKIDKDSVNDKSEVQEDAHPKKGFNSDLYNKYDALFGNYLNTLSHMEFNYQKLRKTRDDVSSAQKKLSEVFHQYARSVTKSAATPNKSFFFTEEISLENLDAESKQQIIFGDKTTTFFDIDPPGIDPPMLHSVAEDGTIKSKTPIHPLKSAEKQNSAMKDKKAKPVILNDSKNRYTGTLKFFEESKNYGFLVMDKDGSDIFVHHEELSRIGLTKEQMKDQNYTKDLKFSFCAVTYIGKHQKSRKAVELKLIRLN